MDKEYRDYTVEDLTQDQRFINWVKSGIESKEWEILIKNNPDLVKNIKVARKIVESLRLKENVLTDDEVYASWEKVKLYYQQHRQSPRKLLLSKWMKYAAILFIIAAIGSLGSIIYFNHNEYNQYFTSSVSPSTIKDAKLILSNGQEYLIKEKQSNLLFNPTGTQIKLNKDSVITYDKTNSGVMNQIVMPYGKRSDLVLSDGTQVILNAGSSLMFPQKFTGKERKVFLKGEAYFKVTKNKNMPFVVASPEMNVTVLGTEFNVNNISDKHMVVVLVEGSVRLNENRKLNFFSKELVLKPNQKAEYVKSENKIEVKSNIDVSFYTSWKDGILKFDEESVLDVFDQLSRYYNVQFITDSNVELSKRIGGKLDLKDSLEEVLKVISDAALISFQIDHNKVFIRRK